ncbi:MAG: ATP-binding protein [Thermoleophilia bacterium]
MDAMDSAPPQDSSSYLPRWLEPAVRASVSGFPVTVVTGARQVGKTTLLQNLEPGAAWKYLTLDDLATRAQAKEDPGGLWASGETVVIDEVQREPDLLLAVKQAVDQGGGGRFVLSGSANLLLMQHVSETLAGRAAYHVLAPLTAGEEKRADAPLGILKKVLRGLPEEGLEGHLEGRPPKDAGGAGLDPRPLILRGFMPRVALAGAELSPQDWWDGYVATYLERDLRQLSDVSSLVDFRRVMQALALRTGRLLNQAEVGRDSGVSGPTLNRWLNLLEAGHLAVRLPAFAGNRTKRILKSPKLYWVDPALAAFLAGHWSLDSLSGSDEEGHLFENLIHHHLAVLARMLSPAGRLYHYREQSGLEVDFVLEHGRRLAAFEVKLSERVDYRDARGLKAFVEGHPSCGAGLLVYAGDEVRRLGDRVTAVPWTLLAEGGSGGSPGTRHPRRHAQSQNPVG